MNIRPPAFDHLVAALARFPSIGPKTAGRIALWLLNQPPAVSEEIASALVEARAAMRHCRVCYQYAESELCPVCSDESRDRAILMVVEEAVDVWSFERTRRHHGLYHVLGGAISPLDGVGPENLTIDLLVGRVREGVAAGQLREVILATDPDTEGAATAGYIAELLAPTGVALTRLAQGLPIGVDLAHSDEATLGEALACRRPLTESGTPRF